MRLKRQPTSNQMFISQERETKSEIQPKISTMILPPKLSLRHDKEKKKRADCKILG